MVTTLVLSLGGPTTVLPIHRFPAIWSPSQFWNKEYPDQDLHCLTREGVNFLVGFALGSEILKAISHVLHSLCFRIYCFHNEVGGGKLLGVVGAGQTNASASRFAVSGAPG